MITLMILAAGRGTKLEVFKMLLTAIALDSIYIIPMLIL